MTEGAGHLRDYGAVLAILFRPVRRADEQLPKAGVRRHPGQAARLEQRPLAKHEPVEEIRALKGQPGDPLRSIGSITLVRHLMEAGLVPCSK
jgi:hypothetical protein